MLSVSGVNPTTRTGTSSPGSAHIAATTAAAPAMSHFMSIIESAGLIDRPPESNVMPLPTSAIVSTASASGAPSAAGSSTSPTPAGS